MGGMMERAGEMAQEQIVAKRAAKKASRGAVRTIKKKKQVNKKILNRYDRLKAKPRTIMSTKETLG